jgi:hypothetical protein
MLCRRATFRKGLDYQYGLWDFVVEGVRVTPLGEFMRERPDCPLRTRSS